MRAKGWLGAVIFLIGASITTGAAAADSSWTSIGPYGGAVTALAINPISTGTVYAATQGGGVFRTDDGSVSWRPVNEGLPGLYVQALAIDPAHPNTLYAAPTPDLAKSVDGGATWQTLAHPDFEVTALAIDPEATGTVYIATERGIAKSTDGGATWSATVAPPGFAGPVLSLTVDPRRSNFVYAATRSGVARSIDGGLSWARAGTLDGQARAVVVSRLRSTRVYAGQVPNSPIGSAQAGFFVSTNGGRQWTASSSGLGAFGVTAIAEVSNRIYAGTDGGGVYVSDDLGAHWAKSGNASEVFSVNVLTANPQRGSTVYAGTGSAQRQDQGLRRTFDSGLSWPVMNQGLAACQISALAADPANRGHLVTGTIGALGIFSRTFDDTAWTPIDDGLPFLGVSSLAFDPHDATGQTIYGVVHGLGGSGKHARLVKTSDGGNLWTQLPISAPFPYIPLSDYGGLAVAPDLLDTAYVGTLGAVLTVAGDGARTTVGSGTGATQLFDLAVAPSAPGVLYAVGLPSIHGGGGLFASVDHGATWQGFALPELASFYRPHLAIDWSDAKTVFFAGDTALYRSTDGGAHWLAAGPGGRAAALASGPGVVYAALVPPAAPPAPPAIWISRDSGVTWAPYSDLPPTLITELVVDPEDPTTLYAGATGGVYVRVQPAR